DMTDAITYQNYIDGSFVGCDNLVEVRNPATGALLSRVPDSDSATVERAIAAARTAQTDWAHKPANERAGYLPTIPSKSRQHAERLARVITGEQGKIQSLALVEVNFTADYMDYMAEWARRIEGEIITSDRPGENIFLF
ncbi:aldehyde dehydrogenase family protein, partial [Leclercia adecarboxylata]|uniref:aldehyde dehydrogenase family protein n=1 Tax=Leclercia adecarboxylata TaxID=83655 RepID=UPI00234C5791